MDAVQFGYWCKTGGDVRFKVFRRRKMRQIVSLLDELPRYLKTEVLSKRETSANAASN